MRKFSKFSLLMLILCNFIYVSNANAVTINAASCSQSDVQAAINSASDGDTVIVPAGSATWSSSVTCNKGMTIIGAGKTSTFITTSGFYAFKITSGNGHRITGFSFDGSDNSSGGGIVIWCDSKQFRIDHCKFDGCRKAVELYGYTYGVIDHCEFKDYGGGVDVKEYNDDAAWDRPLEYGTADFVFVEDCDFMITSEVSIMTSWHAVMGQHGGRFVFRHNTVSNDDSRTVAPIDMHGYCYWGRGTVGYEVYNNTISGNCWHAIFIRSGNGVVFNNTFTGTHQYPIRVKNYRSCAACTLVSPTTCTEGYPCIDQTTELYIWGNTYGGGNVTAYVDSCCSDHIQEGRDYFHFEKPGYTPFTYPHPLIKPFPPSNLRIME